MWRTRIKYCNENELKNVWSCDVILSYKEKNNWKGPKTRNSLWRNIFNTMADNGKISL